jgi:hypothetical protein
LIHLTTIAAFGDALIGRRIRAAATPQQEAEAQQSFELWFGAMMDRHVVGKAADDRRRNTGDS